MDKSDKPNSLAQSMLLTMNVVLFALVVMLLYKSSSRFYEGYSQVLADVDNRKITRIALSDQTIESLKNLEIEKYRILKESADALVENVVLEETAKTRKMTPREVLEREVRTPTDLTEKEIYAAYVKSPRAHLMPYDQALKEISEDLKLSGYLESKKKFLTPLLAKHRIRYHIQAPTGFNGKNLPEKRRFAPFEIKPAGAEIIDKKVDRAASLGPSEAPVLLEVFSDFMCPFSAQFSETIKKLRQDYPDKLRVEFKHQPLAMHPGAELVAEASVCAQEQGKFWEYHDALFVEPAAKNQAALIGLARDMKLDENRFLDCLKGRKYKDFVNQNIKEAKDRGVRGTPSYFINGNLFVGIKPIENLKPVIDWFIDPKGAYPGAEASRKPNPAVQTQKNFYEFKEEDLRDNPSQGPKKAPITLIEFIDYNCPFCKKGSDNLMPVIQKHKAKIRFISKQNPLAFHPNARKGAQAALCAGDQGKYWEYRASIFGKNWGKQTPDELKGIAKDLGLNESSFNACLDSDRHNDIIDNDLALAKSCDVSGTPTYFVNGKPLVGAKPSEDMERAIEEGLK